MAEHRVRIVAWTAFVTFPLAGLSILLAAPHADVRWENHPSHFWLVLGTSIATAILAYATGEVAARRGDGRLFLVSLGFLAAAGFLGLHALATPKVLLDAPNGGFVLATPVGLLVAAALAALSAAPGEIVTRNLQLLRVGLIVLMVVWAVASLAEVAPLNDPTPPESGSAPLTVLAVAGIALYGYAALRYAALYRRRRSAIIVAVVTAFILLAEAMVAVAFARNWHASWWEWHVLMLAAFALDRAGGARAGPGRALQRPLPRGHGGRQARRERGVRRPGRLHRLLRRPRPARGVRDAQRLLRGGDPGRGAPSRRRDRPAHRRRDDGHLQHARRSARPRRSAPPPPRSTSSARRPRWPPHTPTGRAFASGSTRARRSWASSARGEGRSYTVVGDTVNVASRLQAAAPVGGVAVGAATLRHLPGARVESLGALELRGKRDPVDAYVLEAPALTGPGYGHGALRRAMRSSARALAAR